MIHLFIPVVAVLFVAFLALQRMAARHIDLSKITDDDRKMYDWFQTRVRPSSSNLKPEGKKLLRLSYAVWVALVVWMLGFGGYWMITKQQSGPAAERWGIGR